ncbi:hypothetical protein HHI36_017653 [Cryptolaemus montrouzieri]|uniref:Uncharacterized protein n=1 Tax=Cryptolaemus montrouzieri TaxID=559131 RepID=A0ABD2NNB3_9CUCU
MEIGKTQIARLVLGYLKNEKCSTAFNEFLTTSQYLKQQAIFIKNGKYFATRVGGLTLEDIIREYSEMSFIIQGKLEQTSYYEEEHKMNLVEQLIYILDNPQPIPTLSKDLNTTPSESLPGNSIEPENMGNISQILSHTLLDKPELHEKLADAINSVRVSQDDNAAKN